MKAQSELVAAKKQVSPHVYTGYEDRDIGRYGGLERLEYEVERA